MIEAEKIARLFNVPPELITGTGETEGPKWHEVWRDDEVTPAFAILIKRAIDNVN